MVPFKVDFTFTSTSTSDLSGFAEKSLANEHASQHGGRKNKGIGAQ
jgi:hypothetical protein